MPAKSGLVGLRNFVSYSPEYANKSIFVYASYREHVALNVHPFVAIFLASYIR